LKYIRQKIPDLILIEPKTHSDSRGYFLETFRKDSLEKKIGHKIDFVQDNESMSTKGTLRGLHYQLPPFTQSKLLRVVTGSIIDVAVDIRNNSPTFGKHIAIELNEESKKQLYIPHGFAHGFLVLSEFAIVCYKTDNFYAKDYERGIAYNDESLAIDWKVQSKDILVSEKDNILPHFSLKTNYFE
jgi:dTDP-4-dehydrorhamnose 3,5-epimerase